MIEIIKHPGVIASGSAEHGFTFSGTELHSASRCETRVRITNNSVVGDILRLSFGNGAINLEFTTESDGAPDSGLIFPPKASMEQIAAVFSSNYIVSKHYNITTVALDDDWVYLKSKGEGSFYNAIWDDTDSGGHFQGDHYFPGIDAIMPDNYKSVWGALKNNDALFDGFYFDIPSGLNQYIDLGKFFSRNLAYPYPHSDASAIIHLSCDVLQLYNAEYLNGQYQKKFIWDSFKYLPFLEAAVDYLTKLQNSGSFMHPAPEHVWDEVPFFLYYLGLSDDKEYTLKAFISYTDNATILHQIAAKAAVMQGDLMMFPCGINTNSLNQINTTKTIFKYKLQLFEGTTKVAETKDILRIEEPEIAECFYYRTHLSVFHNLLKCSVKKSLETSGKEIRSKNHLDFQVEKSNLDFEVISSPMFKEECELVEKGFLANDILWLKDGVLVQVGLIPGSFLIYDDLEDLHRISFKVRTVAAKENIISAVEGSGSGASSNYTYLRDGVHLLDDDVHILGF